MALLQVRLEGRLENQILQTIWNYTDFSTSSRQFTMEEFANAFGVDTSVPDPFFTSGSVLGNYQVVTSSSFDFLTLEVFDVYDATALFTIGFSGLSGDGAATHRPVFEAASLKAPRNSRVVRAGFKRIPAIPSDYVNSGGGFVPAAVSNYGDLANAMSQNLTVGASSIPVTPVIVAKERYVVPGSVPSRTAYRYYEDQVVQLARTRANPPYVLEDRVTTQNSRKIGRGQ